VQNVTVDSEALHSSLSNTMYNSKESPLTTSIR
jgi:hypothetical protein